MPQKRNRRNRRADDPTPFVLVPGATQVYPDSGWVNLRYERSSGLKRVFTLGYNILEERFARTHDLEIGLKYHTDLLDTAVGDAHQAWVAA